MDLIEWYTATVYMSLIKYYSKWGLRGTSWPIIVYNIHTHIKYALIVPSRFTIKCSNDENKLSQVKRG